MFHKDVKPDQKKCKKVVNGYLCTVSNADLNTIKERNKLSHQIEKKDDSTKLYFTDGNGNVVANAIRIGDSNIRLFSDRPLL